MSQKHFLLSAYAQCSLMNTPPNNCVGGSRRTNRQAGHQPSHGVYRQRERASVSLKCSRRVNLPAPSTRFSPSGLRLRFRVRRHLTKPIPVLPKRLKQRAGSCKPPLARVALSTTVDSPFQSLLICITRPAHSVARLRRSKNAVATKPREMRTSCASASRGDRSGRSPRPRFQY
jgi:hypothetical protein